MLSCRRFLTTDRLTLVTTDVPLCPEDNGHSGRVGPVGTSEGVARVVLVVVEVFEGLRIKPSSVPCELCFFAGTEGFKALVEAFFLDLLGRGALDCFGKSLTTRLVIPTALLACLCLTFLFSLLLSLSLSFSLPHLCLSLSLSLLSLSSFGPFPSCSWFSLSLALVALSLPLSFSSHSFVSFFSFSVFLILSSLSLSLCLFCNSPPWNHMKKVISSTE